MSSVRLSEVAMGVRVHRALPLGSKNGSHFQSPIGVVVRTCSPMQHHPWSDGAKSTISRCTASEDPSYPGLCGTVSRQTVVL